jgi:pimeloyl-ACP methyl ester carboxylesterase
MPDEGSDRRLTDFSAKADFSGERRSIINTPDAVITVHDPLGTVKGRVVVVPGWSGPRSGPADILVFLATELAKNGWRVLRIDIPGRGDASGDRAAVGLDEMIAAALHAATLPSEDASATAFLGMCSGGNVSLGALSLAANLPPGLTNSSVIALSTLPFQPARSSDFERRRMWKNIKQYAGKAASPQTWARLLKGEINLNRVKKNVTASEKPASGERNLKDSARDIEKELLQWKGPGLLIWGSGDEEAALARAHFEKLHASGMGAPGATRFHTITGANHNYYSRAWRHELAREIVSFLNGK